MRGGTSSGFTGRNCRFSSERTPRLQEDQQTRQSKTSSSGVPSLSLLRQSYGFAAAGILRRPVKPRQFCDKSAIPECLRRPNRKPGRPAASTAGKATARPRPERRWNDSSPRRFRSKRSAEACPRPARWSSSEWAAAGRDWPARSRHSAAAPTRRRPLVWSICRMAFFLTMPNSSSNPRPEKIFTV